jgi:TIR domain
MSYVVFVNYRVGDQQEAAGLIAEILRARFGPDKIFQASISILPSRPFPDEILTAVRGATVLLAVIGERWLTVADETGRPRIHSESDWVRREIAEALAAGVVIVPVLVGANTRSLRDDELPEEIRPLATLQFIRLRYGSVGVDVSNLVRDLTVLAPGLQAAPTGPRPVDPHDLGAWFRLLWTRLAEVLERRPAPDGLRPDPAKAAEALEELIRLRDALAPYAEELGLLEARDVSLRAWLARLRDALEAVFGQPLVLPGTGTRVFASDTSDLVGKSGEKIVVDLASPDRVAEVVVDSQNKVVNGRVTVVRIGKQSRDPQ